MAAPTPGVPARKADYTWEDMKTYGGSLNPKQLDRWIEMSKVNADLLGIVNYNRLQQAEGLLEFANLSGRVSVPATEFTALTADERAKLSTSKKAFNCKDFRGEVWLSQKQLNNNLMKERLGPWLMSEMAAQVGIDIQEYALNSITTHSDPNYAEFNGILAQPGISINPVSADTIDDGPFYDMEVLLLQQAATDRLAYGDVRKCVYLMSAVDRAAYQNYLQSDDTARGTMYRELDGTEIMMFHGRKIIECHGMPAGTMLMTRLDNIHIAVGDELRFRLFEMPREDAYSYLVYYSLDAKIAFANGAIIHKNLATPTVATE